MVARGSDTANKADALVAEFCRQRPSIEIETAFNDVGIACSRVFEPEDMLHDEHYQERETLTEWFDESLGKTVRGPDIIPRLRNNPTAIWRAGPRYSEDTEDILTELGYTSAEQEALYASGTTIRAVAE